MSITEHTIVLRVDFILFDNDIIRIEGSFGYDGLDEKPQMSVRGGTESSCELRSWPNFHRKENDMPHYFEACVSLGNAESIRISFYGGVNGQFCRIQGYNRLCCLSDNFANAFYHNGRWCVRIHDGSLVVERYTKIKGLLREAKLGFELFKKGHPLAVFLRFIAKAYKRFTRRKLWLICDRLDQAGDNAEAIFKHLCKNPQPNVKPVFLVLRQSGDYKRLKKLGLVMPFFNGFDILIFLLCECKVSSHALPYFTNPFGEELDMYRDIVADTRYIFLQHGVLKDDLSSWLNRYNRNIYGFITSTFFEYEQVRGEKYSYRPENIWLTGMPRYDNLYNSPQKRIYVMPTWRKYLMVEKYDILGKRHLKESYFTSSFFTCYKALLNNEKLHTALRKLGYSLYYVPHPMFRNYPEHMPCENGVIYDDSADYQNIFANASLIVTDYSSIAFDFAYLQKPIIYWHFDVEKFYSGEHTFSKSSYDYATMGFGEVENTLEEIVERIIEYAKNECRMKEIYRKRVQSCFAYHDTNNCERVIQQIINSYLL